MAYKWCVFEISVMHLLFTAYRVDGCFRSESLSPRVSRRLSVVVRAPGPLSAGVKFTCVKNDHDYDYDYGCDYDYGSG